MRILIIGAGAAGLSAAIEAARLGAGVTVLDHNGEPGKKILITGRGRANLTNTDISERYFHEGKKGFTKSIIKRAGYEEIKAFLSSTGLKLKVKHYDFDERGYVYPLSEKASDVRDALYGEALKQNVRFYFNVDASHITDPFNSKFGSFDSIILASGGNSHPETGSDSSIYPLLMRLKLPFNRFYPALTSLYTRDEALISLKGKRVRSRADLLIDGSLRASEAGEIQFNAHSISGIPVMNLSGEASYALKEGQKVELAIEGKSFKIYRTGGFKHSQVSRGGLNLNYIDPLTLKSMVTPGVFAAGELLDVDGECGGYNLHFAFASGIISARGALFV